MDQKTFLVALIINLALSFVFICIILLIRKRNDPSEELWRKRQKIADAYLGQSKKPILVFFFLCILAVWLYDIVKKFIG